MVSAPWLETRDVGADSWGSGVAEGSGGGVHRRRGILRGWGTRGWGVCGAGSWCRELRQAPGAKQGAVCTCITALHLCVVPVAAGIWGWCRVEVFYPALFLRDKAVCQGLVSVLG